MFNNCSPATLAICDDCLFILANGETQPDGEYAEYGQDQTEVTSKRLARQWPGVDITLGSLTSEGCGGCSDTDGDGCGWFSWHSCDGCGSTLGGNRSHATAWIPNPRVIAQRLIRDPDGPSIRVTALQDHEGVRAVRVETQTRKGARYRVEREYYSTSREWFGRYVKAFAAVRAIQRCQH